MEQFDQQLRIFDQQFRTPALLFLIVGLIVLAVVSAIKRRRKRHSEKSEREFLEAALAPEDTQKQGSPYTFAEYEKDVHDGKLTFEEIWEKCGGIYPTKPEAPLGTAESEVVKSDRMKEMQDWFNQMAQKQGTVKVVAPPPQAPAMVMLSGQTVPCTGCATGGRFSTNSLRETCPPILFTTREGKCQFCGGTGFMVITKG